MAALRASKGEFYPKEKAELSRSALITTKVPSVI